MKKMGIAMILALQLLTLIGCSNRYMASYTGESFPSSDQCELVTAEMQSIRNNEDISLEELRGEYEKAGYKVIGVSYKKAVPLNGSHKLDVQSSCEKVGAQIALYDNGNQILYLRKVNDEGDEEEVNNVTKETLPTRKTPVVLGIIGALLVLGLILQVAGANGGGE